MTLTTQHTEAGAGLRLHAPDATVTVKVGSEHTDEAYEIFEISAPKLDPTPLHRTGWPKTYYMLDGRMLVQVEQETFELGPGSSIAIPPNALHTFSVLTAQATFLVFSLTAAMGRFHADLDASVPQGMPLDEAMPLVFQVLSRHDVSMDGVEVVR